MGFATGAFEEGHFSNFDHAVLRYASGDIMAFADLFQGAHNYEISLAAAPFSGIKNLQLASICNRIGSFVHELGELLYHFERLRAFKQKFDPIWAPNYLASLGGHGALRIRLLVLEWQRLGWVPGKYRSDLKF